MSTPIDRREQILQRLEAVMAALPGVVTAKRNVAPVSQKAFPAIIVFDGSETQVESNARQFRGRASRMRPRLMDLQPEVFFLYGQNPGADRVGTVMSEWRNKILKAVLNDQALAAFTGENGWIDYRAADSDLRNGMALQGQMRIDLSFGYPLLPAEL